QLVSLSLSTLVSLPPILRPPSSPPFPSTTLFRSSSSTRSGNPAGRGRGDRGRTTQPEHRLTARRAAALDQTHARRAVSRCSGCRSEETRLNSSHEWISYAVFCLKKKKIQRHVRL